MVRIKRYTTECPYSIYPFGRGSTPLCAYCVKEKGRLAVATLREFAMCDIKKCPKVILSVETGESAG